MRACRQVSCEAQKLGHPQTPLVRLQFKMSIIPMVAVCATLFWLLTSKDSSNNIPRLIEPVPLDMTYARNISLNTDDYNQRPSLETLYFSLESSFTVEQEKAFESYKATIEAPKYGLSSDYDKYPPSKRMKAYLCNEEVEFLLPPRGAWDSARAQWLCIRWYNEFKSHLMWYRPLARLLERSVEVGDVSLVKFLVDYYYEEYTV